MEKMALKKLILGKKCAFSHFFQEIEMLLKVYEQNCASDTSHGGNRIFNPAFRNKHIYFL